MVKILGRSSLNAAIAGLLVLFMFLSTRSQTGPPVQTPKKASSQPGNPPKKTQSSTDEEVGPDDVIRVKTTLVNSPVLVIGRDGKFVPNLRREDFQVFEEGVKQDIAYFAPVDNPFTVALLIDTSRSTLFDLQDIQDAAISFVDKMRSNDRALVVSFSDQVKVLAEPTSDRDKLRNAIRSSRPDGSTRVYDAIDFALAEVLDRVRGRTALIVFTDGVDTDSRAATYESTLRRIERTEALIYPVQFRTYQYMKGRSQSPNRTPPEGSGFSQQDYLRADAYLHQVADVTGTGVYPASDMSDLDRAVASIVDELHNEYSVGYYPRALGQPGEARRVEVRVNQPQLIVRARTGYVVDQSGAVVRSPKSGRSSGLQASDMSGSLAVPRSTDALKPAMGARWMCKGPNAPSDFAVVKEGFVSNCPKSTRPNDETNAWFIRRPGPSEILCKGFLIWNGRELSGAPIPTGYVVTGEVASPVCSKSNHPQNTTNAWTIRLPAQGDTVCKGFLIPRGYVVMGERTAAGCPAKSDGKNAWLIRSK